tara:strand:+ start:157 stop:351 length:195 start_codon:yes stop_codon:yes gene_type:complete
MFGEKYIKKVYNTELKNIFGKKTALTLNECSINVIKFNFDLSKYLFSLLAYNLFILQFLITELE